MPTDGFSRFNVRLTQDMAETLAEHFKRFAEDGVVTLEVNAAGVWFVDPETERVMFLGKADHDRGESLRVSPDVTLH